MNLWYFISASSHAGTLFTFPEACGGSALGSDPTCLVLISSLSFHLRVTSTSQLLSRTWFVITPNVMAKNHHSLTYSNSTNSSCSPTHSRTSLPPGPHIFCFQICHFILSISQIQYSFFFLSNCH